MFINSISYTAWLIFGLVLILSELAIPNCIIMWFGFGAIYVGGLLYFIPSLSLNWQVFLWIIFSTINIIAWFKYFKKILTDRTMAGMSLEAAIGQQGLIIKSNIDSESVNIKGRIRFNIPLMGETDWDFICNEKLKVGDSAKVVNVTGNSFLVEKI